MSSGANVISRPYSGQKLAFMPGTFDAVAQLLATIKRTVGLPNFSFREIKSSGKYEVLLGKYEGITFPSEEIPSIIGFESIPDGNGNHIGYKMNPNENRLMKSDDTKAYYEEFPADLCAGKHLIFIYTNIIEYHYVGDTEAPFLRVIDSKQAFMPGTFDTVAQLLATIKRTVGLPNFSFREIKSSGKYEVLLGKYEGITLPSEEIPSIIGFKVFLTVTEFILGTK